MANFQPLDFSPIHGGTERPSKPGWYCTEHVTSFSRFLSIHSGHAPAKIRDFARWDGMNWRAADDDRVYPWQDFAWFGLKAPA